MAKRLRYHPLFDGDVREAANWYDLRSPGLGEAFIAMVRKRVNDVIADPNRYGRTPSGCRYVRLTRFPYLLLFEITEDELLLLGVLHTARSLEKWRQSRAEDG